MKAKILKMLSMQEEFNTLVDPEWRLRNFPWYRAIWTECAELVDYMGWKWWKKQAVNSSQAKLELVDIWHFGMSQMLQVFALVYGEESQTGVLAKISDNIEDYWQNYWRRGVIITKTTEEFILRVEHLAQATLRYRGFDINCFFNCVKAADMSFDELYALYIGKNVLNKFRQDHGYNEGTYRKLWSDGEEDNVHLSELCTSLDCNVEGFEELLYSELGSRYAISV